TMPSNTADPNSGPPQTAQGHSGTLARPSGLQAVGNDPDAAGTKNHDRHGAESSNPPGGELSLPGGSEGPPATPNQIRPPYNDRQKQEASDHPDTGQHRQHESDGHDQHRLLVAWSKSFPSHESHLTTGGKFRNVGPAERPLVSSGILLVSMDRIGGT